MIWGFFSKSDPKHIWNGFKMGFHAIMLYSCFLQMHLRLDTKPDFKVSLYYSEHSNDKSKQL